MVPFLIISVVFITVSQAPVRALLPINQNLLKNINLIASPTPTHILLPPPVFITLTATPVPPTATPVAPTVTPIPPTATSTPIDVTTTPKVSPLISASASPTMVPTQPKGGWTQTEAMLGGVAGLFGLTILFLLWPKIKTFLHSKTA